MNRTYEICNTFALILFAQMEHKSITLYNARIPVSSTSDKSVLAGAVQDLQNLTSQSRGGVI
jgi:hypothetical protein